MRRSFSQLHNVHIRSWDDQDIEGYADLLADPEAMKFISAGTTRGRDAAANEISVFTKELIDQDWSRWAVSLGVEGSFIGYAGFAKKEYGINFGNRFLRKYWGTPYPFIAIHLALEYGFQCLGFEQVYTLTNIHHHRALEMNRAFLHMPAVAGEVIDTAYGPHIKIDLTRERFQEIRLANVERITRFSRRMKKPEHTQSA